MSELKNLTKEQLLDWHANACATYYQCHGHNKASRNLYIIKDIENEMAVREMDVPLRLDAAEKGVFNGTGAS